jgi:YggT family protein
MPAAIQTALVFLINTIFDLYTFVLAIRLIMVWEKFNYFNPATQFILRFTDILIKPLRRILPNVQRLETATLVLALILISCKFLLILLLTQINFNSAGLFFLVIGDLLKTIIMTFFYALLMQAILSFVQPFSIWNRTLYDFTTPLLRPLRRIVPAVGNLDLSPLAGLIILQLLLIVLVNPLLAMGLPIPN